MEIKKNSIKIKLIIVMSCLGLQACSGGNSNSALEKQSADQGACVESNQINEIAGASLNAQGVSSSFSVPSSNCSKSFSVSWKTNDGYEAIVSSNESTLDHTYKNPGEYALEAVVINDQGEAKTLVKDVIVQKDCEEDSSCVAIQAPEVAKVNTDVVVDLIDASDSSIKSDDVEWTVKNEAGDTVENKDGVFEAKEPGTHTVTAELSNDQVIVKDVVIMDPVITDQIQDTCDVDQISLSGPSEIHLNESVQVKVELPNCVSSVLKGITWNFSDGQPAQYGEEADLKFSEAGDKSYSVKIIFDESKEIELSRDVVVSTEECSDCSAEEEAEGDNDSGLTDNNVNDPQVSQDPVVESDPNNVVLIDGADCGNVRNGTEVFVENIISGESVSCEADLGNKIVTSSAEKVKRCINGSYVESIKPSTVISETACFRWEKVGATSCTAACGGTQSDIYACVGEGNEISDGNASLCGDAPDNSPYLCDGDPDFEEIRISETIEKGEPRACNSNKTGYIVDKETTREVYQCVNHEITLVDTIVTLEEAPFCLDLKRCSHDSLSPSKAHGRLEWMKKCSDNPKIQEFFETTNEFEYAPQNSYTVNEAGTLIEGRPTYITFQKENGDTWKAPAPGTKNWKTREITELNDVSGLSCDIPDDASIAGICISSCVTPTQRILTRAGEIDMLSATMSNMSDVMSLSPLSTVLRPVLTASPVMQFVTEVVNSEHDILIFTLASGKQIEYTPNHPVVTKEGKIKEAGDFIVGEHFVKKSGELDEVLKIKKIVHFGKVYNVFMKSSLRENNVVVINDYLTGSARFQQEGHDHVDRKVLRSSLVK